MKIYFFILIFTFAYGVEDYYEVKGEDFKDGTFKNVLLTSEGLKKGYTFKEIIDTDEYTIWDIVKKNNSYIFSTGGKVSRLYRINGKKAQKIIELKETDALSLINFKNKIYIGTATSGFVIELKGDTVLATGQNYVWDMEKKGDTLIAGTGPNGLLYYIVNKKIVKIDSLNDAHIMDIAVKDKNTTIVSTAINGKIYRIKKGEKEVLYESSDKELKNILIKKDTLFFAGINDKGDSARVYKYYKGKTEVIFAIDGVINGMEFFDKKLLLTLETGRIYFIDTDGSNVEYTKIRNSIARLKKIGKEIFICSSDEGKIYKVEKSFERGIYISDVITGKDNNIKWGALEKEGNYKGINFYVRGGNSSEVDDEWTGWRRVTNEVKLDKKNLQIKVVFPQGMVNRFVKSFKIWYITENRKPRIEDITWDFQSYDQIKISWETEDPDQDILSYSLFLVKDGFEVNVARDIMENSYYLDFERFPEGEYGVKLIASDSISHDPYNFLKTTKEKDYFIYIDKTPPRLDFYISKKKNSALIKGRAIDNHSRVIVSYSIDGENFLRAEPLDQLFDEKDERFTIKLLHLKKGNHLITVKAEDDYGNIKILSRFFKL